MPVPDLIRAEHAHPGFRSSYSQQSIPGIPDPEGAVEKTLAHECALSSLPQTVVPSVNLYRHGPPPVKGSSSSEDSTHSSAPQIAGVAVVVVVVVVVVDGPGVEEDDVAYGSSVVVVDVVEGQSAAPRAQYAASAQQSISSVPEMPSSQLTVPKELDVVPVQITDPSLFTNRHGPEPPEHAAVHALAVVVVVVVVVGDPHSSKRLAHTPSSSVQQLLYNGPLGSGSPLHTPKEPQ